MFKKKSTQTRKARAQAMAEFALVLPILLLIVYGLLETGRLLFIFASVNTASRQAVRYGSATGENASGVPRYQDCTGITAAANNVAFITNFTAVNITYDRGVDGSGNIVPISGINPDPEVASTCPIANNTIQNGDRVKVFVSAQFAPVIPFIPLDPFTIRSASSRTVLKEIAIQVTAVPQPWTGGGGGGTMTLAKSASPTTYSAVGETINYSYYIQNTGGTTLSSLVVTDDKVSVTCPQTTLATGASTTCTASYVITQADLDNGSVTNTATANASGVSSNTDSVTVTANRNPQITLAKEANPTAAFTVGQTITYTYTIENTGNITLNSPSVSDNKIQNVSCPAGTLAPGAIRTCSATYSITQLDLDAGSVTNLATATMLDGVIAVNSNQASALVITKPLYLSITYSPTTVNQVGTVVTYTYRLRNAGTTTFSAPYAITDNRIVGADCSAAATPLAPGASTTCTATYTVTQADMDAGSVFNTASATAREGGQTVTSNQASANLILVQTPQITLQITPSTTLATNLGQSINYTYTLQNTGNVTLSSPYTITDDKFTGINCGSATSPLAPGASTTCTLSYTVTQTDINNGSIINHATVTAKSGAQTINSNQAISTVITYNAPRLTLEKSASPTSAGGIGEVITYTYTLRNTGNTVLTTPYTISDDKIASIDCTSAASPLDLGASTTCTASYSLTQADKTVGAVTNHAVATVKAGTQTLTSNEATATVIVASCDVRHNVLKTSPFSMTIFNYNSGLTLNVKDITIYWNPSSPTGQYLKSLSLGGVTIWNGNTNSDPASFSTFTGDISIAPNSNELLTVIFDKNYKSDGSERILVTFQEGQCPTIDSNDTSQWP